MVRRRHGITVSDIYEEQEVEVYTVETDVHPAFDAELVMDDGMVIHIMAEEGVLPAGVKATAVRVNNNVEAAVQEILSADTEKNVSSGLMILICGLETNFLMLRCGVEVVL